MSLFHSLASLWRNVVHKHRIERDLSDELNSFIELSVETKMERGLTEAEARRETLVELQGAEQVKERVRESRRGYRIEVLFQDLRYALRTLRKAPAFSLTVSLVLALGIGSTTLMFAIVNSVLVEGPPFPHADRLITLWQRIPQEPRVSFSRKEFAAWQKQTQVFEALSFVTGTGFTITGRGDPATVIRRMVTPAFFQVLRANPILGRAFNEADANERVVVLSHGLWRDKFGLEGDVLGHTVTMNGEPYTIIGVLSETFEFEGTDAQLFVPLSLANPIFAQHPDAHFLRVIGRLKSGITRQQLDSEVNLLGTRVDDSDD